MGRITTWKDDQGYGYITPNGGGPPVFVHITSFAGLRTRPAGNEIVTYALGRNAKGQPRAENVAFVRPGAARRDRGGGAGARWAAAAFVAFLAVCVLSGKLHGAVLGLYLGMSALAFVFYAHDKSAARQGRWRVSEGRLHLLGLLGGWPGALLAQQVLRHKSKKRSFRAVFWLTVLVNCGVLGWLLSRPGAALLQAVLGGAAT